MTVTATKPGDQTRWVRLTIGLRDDSRMTEPTLAVEPKDELAATYGLENWKSGVLSGYFFVCRRARRMPPPPLDVHELSGALGSDDMDGVADAAAFATASLFRVDAPAAPSGWDIRVTSAPPVSV